MELRLYLRMLQTGWWVMVLAALSALNIALVSNYMAVPQYRASAKFIVSPNASVGTGRDVVSSLGTLDRSSVVATYAEVLGSNSLFEETGLALHVDRNELGQYSRKAVVLPGASVLVLSVSGPNPQLAALLANSLGQRAIDYGQELIQVYDVQFLDKATVPSEPFSPQPARDAGLALALGLIGGGLLAILREQVRTPLEALLRRNMLDGASSAYNRRYFQRCLEEEVARRGKGNLSLGVVRLEGLRDMIDTLPPVVTHRLLQQVTKTLRNELRGNDSVGRWDDISFAVLLPATPMAAAQRTLERIQQALSVAVELDWHGEQVNLAPHVGVADSQGDQPAKLLIAAAESALEQSRRNGSQSTAVSVENAEGTK
jgi:diguanylate cyclase (GGDEF)-like protein